MINNKYHNGSIALERPLMNYLEGGLCMCYGGVELCVCVCGGGGS